MIKLNRFKAQHFDSLSSKYLELISTKEVSSQTIEESDSEGVIKLDVVPEAIMYQLDEKGYCMKTEAKRDNICFVLDGEACKIINKAIDDIYKPFSRVVAYKTIQEAVYEWIYLTTFERTSDTFSSYINSHIGSKTASFYFYFPLFNILLGSRIKLGNVILGKLNTQTYNLLLQDPLYKKHASSELPFASIELEGEHEKVQELAYEEVDFAIDIIKLCFFPQFSYEDSFKQNISLLSNSSFPDSFTYFSVKNSDNTVHPYIENNKIPFEIKQEFLSNKHELFALFDNFMSEYYGNEEATEIDKLLHEVISRFSRAITMKSTDEKIVWLCSILDMIVLSSPEVGIKESLKKYIPILVTDDISKRKEIIQDLETMYKCRSEYIHYGKKCSIDSRSLFSYNTIVCSVIIVLMEERKKYTTKEDLRNHIDELFLTVQF